MDDIDDLEQAVQRVRGHNWSTRKLHVLYAQRQESYFLTENLRQQDRLARIAEEQELLKKKQKDAEVDLARAVYATCRALCHPFSSYFMKKLPRELRDMVFDYVCLDVPDCIYEFHICNGTWGIRFGIGKTMRVARGGSPPYFAHKYFVEADFATEAVQALYRTANVTIGNAQYLGHYLENDILGTQCIPRDHIGRFLRICMEAPKDLHDKLGYTKFVKYLNPLFQVKHISSLRIKLILVLDIPFYDRDCDVFSVRFEEILAPTVHRLKKLGAKIQWLRMDSEVMVSSLVQMRERDATQSLEELEKDIAAHSVFKQPINDNAW